MIQEQLSVSRLVCARKNIELYKERLCMYIADDDILCGTQSCRLYKKQISPTSCMSGVQALTFDASCQCKQS